MPRSGRQKSTRSNEPVVLQGAGRHFTSPLKSRDKRKKGAVRPIGSAARVAALSSRLSDLLNRVPNPETPRAVNVEAPGMHTTDTEEQIEDWDDIEAPPPPPPSVPRILATATALVDKQERQRRAWEQLLPLLVGPLMAYDRRVYGMPPRPVPSTLHQPCSLDACTKVEMTVQCLNASYIQQITVKTCDCAPAALLLMEHGLFAFTPTRPSTAISIDLLELYKALFERSCDAITALAAALNTLYYRRGFEIYSQSRPGARAVDPFRKGLAHAVQWYSNIRTLIRKRVEATLSSAEDAVLAPLPPPSTAPSPSAAPSPPLPPPSAPLPPPSSPPPVPPRHPALIAGRAHRVLRQRCPLCFDLRDWGRPLSEGGDVQLGADACFSYRHLKSAGDGPMGYSPEFFIPKEKVAAIRDRIRTVRTRAPASTRTEIPDEALQSCEETWEAANEKKRKADPKRYDASGIFAMVCRHSQVLFLCDVDTPGEQQHFIVACMEEVASLLPPAATLLQAYDVGCVLDRSCNLFPILSEGLRERVAFVINAMHAFGHEWICQLVYNPRFRSGIGLTDAEGVERLWSLIRRLIPLTRAQWNSRRIWMIDQHIAFVNEEGLDALGTWLERQYTKNVLTKQHKAVRVLRDCGVSEAELRQQWEQQKVSQRSHRAYAPARLRKELDKVIALQTQIDVLEKSIAETTQTIKSAGMTTEALAHLRALEASQQKLSTEADALYSTLNIHQSFPSLRDLPLQFVRTLLLMRELKMTIRRRAIGSFYEWETLDRAVAGRRESLGTKLHQATRHAILKRQPALLRSINKFNSYCSVLEQCRPPGCTIPVPQPLSTQLNGLRSDPSLYEDVWIEPSQSNVPRWLEDEDVRDGIRHLHLLDRCREENTRLDRERVNLQGWLDDETEVVSRAIRTTSDSGLRFELQKRLRRLGHLQASWRLAMTQHAASVGFTSVGHTSTSVRTSVRTPVRTPISTSTSLTPSTSFPTQILTPGRRVQLDPEDDEEALDEEEHLGTNETPDLPITVDEVENELSDVEDAIEVHDVLVDSSTEGEESTGVEDSSVSFVIEWRCPENLVVDTTFLDDLHQRSHSGFVILPETSPHTVVRAGDLPNLIIEPGDISRISSRSGRLNGFGINAIAASLENIYSNVWTSPHTAPHAARCAVFTTFDLHRIRYKYSDADVWRHVAPLQYWAKELWLIPIHQQAEEHWTFVAVSTRDQRLLFFDSLSQRRGWRRDIRDVMVLITRMVVLANRHQHALHLTTEDPEEPWLARPLFNLGYPRQSNGHDCGIWVLCTIAAILRGADVTGLHERDMERARQVITTHVCTLPLR